MSQTTLFQHRPIRALSWKEPFASLMLHGKVETRTWGTSYRGDVLICASKIPYTKQQQISIMGAARYEKVQRAYVSKDDYQCGYAIAVGTLVDCYRMTPQDAELCFVEYNPGLMCHVYENVRPIEPMPWKGQQGWKKLDEAIWDKIKIS